MPSRALTAALVVLLGAGAPASRAEQGDKRAAQDQAASAWQREAWNTAILHCLAGWYCGRLAKPDGTPVAAPDYAALEARKATPARLAIEDNMLAALAGEGRPVRPLRAGPERDALIARLDEISARGLFTNAGISALVSAHSGLIDKYWPKAMQEDKSSCEKAGKSPNPSPGSANGHDPSAFKADGYPLDAQGTTPPGGAQAFADPPEGVEKSVFSSGPGGMTYGASGGNFFSSKRGALGRDPPGQAAAEERRAGSRPEPGSPAATAAFGAGLSGATLPAAQAPAGSRYGRIASVPTPEELAELAELQALLKQAAETGELDAGALEDAIAELAGANQAAAEGVRQLLAKAGRDLSAQEASPLASLVQEKFGLSADQARKLVAALRRAEPPSARSARQFGLWEKIVRWAKRAWRRL